MIGYVKGIISHLFLESCYVDVHGVGYRVYIPTSVQCCLQEGQEVCLYTYTNVREDAMQLYGFLSLEEYDLFLLLISVSGIGPKVALGVLSGMTPEQFIGAIVHGDLTALTKLPGIGKKSAERLTLELKDKVTKLNPSLKVDPIFTVPPTPSGVTGEVIEALMALGYTTKEAQPVVEAMYDGTQDVPTLLRQALSQLGKG